MNIRRVIVGILAVTMIVTALVLWFFGGTGELPLVVGMLARIGVVLFTIFVAWPTLERYIHHLPMVVTASIFVCVLILAVRPNLARLFLAMIVIILAVHFGMRFLSKQIK
jgi:hypothetical protein